MSLFSHRGFLVDVTVATEKGEIETQWGRALYFPNDVILTDRNGNVEITTETIFKKTYVPVEEVVDRSEMANAFAEALQGFSLDNSLEDEEYLDGTAEMNGIKHTY